MALLYDAELSPTKSELICDWLPRAPFASGVSTALERVGAFRFDDPAGEVGIEIHLVRDSASGVVYQLPMTYRPAPLPGARLISEMEHSVLGHRYVYDATTDPVYVNRLLATIRSGGAEAEQYLHVEGAAPTKLAGTVRVRGTGSGGEIPAVVHVAVTGDGNDTVIDADGIEIVVHHRPTDAVPAGPALVGDWDGGRGVLASVR